MQDDKKLMIYDPVGTLMLCNRVRALPAMTGGCAYESQGTQRKIPISLKDHQSVKGIA